MARPKKIFIPASPVYCQGKRRYATEREALQVKEEQELMNHGLELKVYRCHVGCGGWHLTKKPTSPST